MTTFDQETLPASLAALLNDEQRQAVIEATREKRLETLAAALARPEPEVLAKLAAAVGLDIASNLETDPEARGLLPARLVHEYQIIPIRFTTEDRGQNTENGSAAESPSSDPGSPFSVPLHLATSWLPDFPMGDWLHSLTARP